MLAFGCWGKSLNPVFRFRDSFQVWAYIPGGRHSFWVWRVLGFQASGNRTLSVLSCVGAFSSKTSGQPLYLSHTRPISTVRPKPSIPKSEARPYPLKRDSHCPEPENSPKPPLSDPLYPGPGSGAQQPAPRVLLGLWFGFGAWCV